MATTAKRVKDARDPRKRCKACVGTGQVDGKRCLTCQKTSDKSRGTGKVFSSRQHNRCKICGRPRAYLRRFGLCRLCFRSLALRGEIPGVSKSSW